MTKASDGSNIVPLGPVQQERVDTASSRTPRAPLSPWHGLVRRLCAETVTGLRGRLEHLFNNADDTLFEMADRAGADVEQQRYFDAMRALRLERGRIESDTLDALTDEVERAQTPAKRDDDGVLSGLELDFDTLSLVDSEALELDVAINGMSSKIRSRSPELLGQFNRRVGEILLQPELKLDDNPFGPARLGRHFTEAIQPLQVDLKIRLVILKLFEMHVVETLPELYTELNQRLIDSGVLPDSRALKRLMNQRPGARTAAAHGPDPVQAGDHDGLTDPAPAAAGPATDAGADAWTGARLAHDPWLHGPAQAGYFPVPVRVGEQLLEPARLQQLLAGLRQGSGPAGARGSDEGALSGAGAGQADYPAGGPTLTTMDIVGALQSLQLQALGEPRPSAVTGHSGEPGAGAGAGAATLAIPAAHLHRIVRQQGQVASGHEDALNLVAMLFDHILEDRSLAVPMKAIIARLQIPILKVALLDASFFSDTDHPARELLNELTRAGIGWSSAAAVEKDATQNEITAIVQTLLTQFGDDLDVISQALERLRAFIHAQDARRNLVEQRVRDSELGRARIDQAGAAIESLYDALHPITRSTLERFLDGLWRRTLKFIFLSDGGDSQAWQRARHLTEHFERFDANGEARPCPSAQWRQRIGDAVLERLALVHCDEVEGDQNLRRLERWFLIDPARLDAVADARQAEQFDAIESLAITSADGEASQDTPRTDEGPAPDQAAGTPGETPVARAGIAGTAPISGTDADTSAEAASDEPGAELDASIARVERMGEGSWLEVPGECCLRPVQGRIRVKLLARHDDLDRFVFTNDRGMKVCEFGRRALATGLQSGAFLDLEAANMFDRALEAVIVGLRDRQSA